MGYDGIRFRKLSGYCDSGRITKWRVADSIIAAISVNAASELLLFGYQLKAKKIA
jgi:hypothetical protein